MTVKRSKTIDDSPNSSKKVSVETVRSEHIATIRREIANPKNDFLKLSLKAICKHFHMKMYDWLCGVISQAWLERYVDAPIQLREKWMITAEKYLSNEQLEVVVKKVGTFKPAIQEVTRISHTGAGKIMRTDKEVCMIGQSEADQIIGEIRSEYILARTGSMPSIEGIMKAKGLLNIDNTPTGPVTEEMVRNKMVSEDWRKSRSDHIYRTFDLIPEEVKIASMKQNIEVQKMLFQTVQVLHKEFMEYHSTGKVTALKDKEKILHVEPNAGTIAGVAETMRRMVDGTTNINILIQDNGEKNQQGDGVSLVARAYMARIANMDESSLRQEIERMEKMARVIVVNDNAKLTMDDIENQE